MARFAQTLAILKEIGGHMPAVTAGIPRTSAGRMSRKDFVEQLMDILQREDYDSIRISLLTDKLIRKYRGRAV